MSGKRIAQQVRLSLQVPSARGAAERWRTQYQKPDGSWTRTYAGDSEAIYGALCGLGREPDPDRVAELIGNKSWTHPRCSGCNEEVNLVVCFDDCWGDDKPSLCPDCIAAAEKLLKAPRSSSADRGTR